jgi:hypothetical protein
VLKICVINTKKYAESEFENSDFPAHFFGLFAVFRLSAKHTKYTFHWAFTPTTPNWVCCRMRQKQADSAKKTAVPKNLKSKSITPPGKNAQNRFWTPPN